mgnify:CR=1 FL=1
MKQLHIKRLKKEAERAMSLAKDNAYIISYNSSPKSVHITSKMDTKISSDFRDSEIFNELLEDNQRSAVFNEISKDTDEKSLTPVSFIYLNNSYEIAKMTLKCLKENVPSDVPGIAFLSGGQTEVEATQNLNEINKINDTSFVMSFSYGRALQQSALKNWSKDIKDTTNTQKIFNHRSKMNGLSTSAKWTMDLEKQINV